MSIINTAEFIKKYEELYFNDSVNRNKKVKDRLGINQLNGSDRRAENEVMQLLKSSTFNKDAMAWKAGRIGWVDNRLTTINFEKNGDYLNGFGGHIEQKAFEVFCEYLCKNSKNKGIINGYVKEEKWKEAYGLAVEKAPKNMGPVYILCALFFLTAGKAPIYDAFAHKAVKALWLGIAPSEVYLGENPEKKNVDQVVAMYKEYVLLLKKVFEKEINTGDMFISRELDRALWVYGHSNIKEKKPEQRK